MSLQPSKDLYAFDPADVENPPASWGGALRRIGPGMILSASIVGSGELIATTTLGAKVGYVALWVILLSCFIKPAVQAAIGRFTVATGQTGLAGFDMLPGPRAGVRWAVWMWAIMVLVTQFQVGAMYGGVAQVLHLLVPSIHMNAWVALLVAITLALLLGGGYR
ncbi:MAG: Nramp family divalent metal transporter, partial [Acidobacteria bacterium]|nr:Nramp family divalent metal transporter [Acidobacteriota bacterium]